MRVAVTDLNSLNVVGRVRVIVELGSETPNSHPTLTFNSGWLLDSLMRCSQATIAFYGYFTL